MTTTLPTLDAKTLAMSFEPTRPEVAAALVASIYGIAGTTERLSSERDETFAFHADNGRRFVLKIASPEERPQLLEFQSGALLHLEAYAPQLPIPRVVRPLAGGHDHRLPEGRIVRLLSFLDGEQLARVSVTPALLEQLGRLLAQLHLGLAGHRPQVPPLDLLWDISHANRLLPLAAEVDDKERRMLVETALRGFRDELLPMQADLPVQVIHNDMNPYNILVSADAAAISGIIDFGDMIEAARVNDLAVALSYHVGAPGGQALVRAFLAGYRSLVTLTSIERRALGLLIKARLAMTVVITESRAKLKPAEARYILRNHPVSLAGLQLLMAQKADTDFLGD